MRSVIRSGRWMVLTVAAAFLLTGCGTDDDNTGAVSDEQASGVTIPIPTTRATTTTAPSAAPSAAGGPQQDAVNPASLASPLALEQRLASLHFDVIPDGVMDDNTRQALIAVQKLSGLARTGQPTPDVLNTLASFKTPAPLRPDGGANRVEIDLSRQVLFLYTNGRLNKILPVSTGTGKRYCDEGKCGIATTPRGSYRVERRISGWRKSDLGRLYNPIYFTGGIAIHGFPSVPAKPASHGCVRIPMGSADTFAGLVPDGTPVLVV